MKLEPILRQIHMYEHYETGIMCSYLDEEVEKRMYSLREAFDPIVDRVLSPLYNEVQMLFHAFTQRGRHPIHNAPHSSFAVYMTRMRQCRLILERLRQGPVTNRELAEIALKYSGRISDLRKSATTSVVSSMTGRREWQPTN